MKAQAMIDIYGETLVSLDEVAEFMKATQSSVYAWTRKGCRGVKLESVQLGGKRYSTREAVARFVAALSDPARVEKLRESTGGYVHARSVKARRREAKRSSERLRKAGA